MVFVSIAVTLVLQLHSEDKSWRGEAAKTMHILYDTKRAEACNSREITVYYNQEIVCSDTTLEELYLDNDMNLQASALAVSKILKMQVTALDGDVCELSRSDNVVVPMQNCVGENLYMPLADICEAMQLSYVFDEVKNACYIAENTVTAQALPAQYDMRSEQRVPQVLSQGNNGTCWAFASLSAVESSLLPNEALTFSVDHLTMNNGFGTSQADGGDFLMALAYLAAWKGPVYEADDPYGDGVSNTALTAVKHLQSAVCIGEKDYTTIKKMIMQYGGVQSSFYSDIEYSNVSTTYYNMDNASYYYNGLNDPNHDIVIVGWDDTYSKEHFNIQPDHDGAFICQNSWGTSFGQNGYFYISYDDYNIGNHNIVYTQIENNDNYDYIYQTDELGWLGSIGYSEPGAWFANVYTAPERQQLRAVSFYTTDKTSYYKVYAVPEYTDEDSLKDRILLSSGYLEQSGYYTVNVDETVYVEGDYAVMVYVWTQDVQHPIAIEYNSTSFDVEVDLSDGQGYISYDGREWQRAEDNYQCNLCLKAFADGVE